MASRIFSGLDGGKITSLFVSLLMFSSFGLSVYADTLLYDANGNLIQGEGRCFVYDGGNRLRSVTDCGSNVLAEYSYDHTGRRVLKVEHSPQGDVSTYYFSDDYEEVHYPNGTVKKVTYYRANGELVGRKEVVNGFERMYFVHGDHLGSTSVVTDSSGNKVEEVHYYPFGSMRTELSDTDSKYLFTGQELDSETGLYYYKSRYYNPGTGRFAQPDTLIPDVYDPQSLNRYSYVENNPVKYVDPAGHNPAVLYYGTMAVMGLGAAVSEFAMVMSESPVAFAFFETTDIAYNEAGLEGVAVNTAEWVVGSKILGSIGGRIAGTLAKTKFARQLTAVAKEKSPGLYNSLKAESKTITDAPLRDYKDGLAKETVLTEDISAIRYFGGKSDEKSSWFTVLGESSENLALPEGATAADCVKVTIKADTKVRTGFTNDGALQIEVLDDYMDSSKVVWGE